MAVEALKSASITNLDATPPSTNTGGEGAPGRLQHIGDYATVSASASVGSTYRLARVPSNAKVKAVFFEAQAMGAGKFNLSVYYSSSTVDGTQVINQGVIVPTTGDQFFAADIDCASAVSRAGYTNQSGNYPVNKRNQPLWQALGLASDPGGFFDVVAVVHTTAVTTGAAKIAAEVEYVM